MKSSKPSPNLSLLEPSEDWVQGLSFISLEMEDLLLIMQCQRAFHLVWEDRCTHHKPILLSSVGSTFHTNNQRALSMTCVIHKAFGAFCCSGSYSSFSLILYYNPPCTVDLEHTKWLSILYLPTHKHVYSLLFIIEIPFLCFSCWNINNIEVLQQTI